MAEDWARDQVEGAVADYLSMLYAERSGIPYNKPTIGAPWSVSSMKRTDGSVERKHQNISAVLMVEHEPHIGGRLSVAKLACCD
jgi:hypothetical protein